MTVYQNCKVGEVQQVILHSSDGYGLGFSILRNGGKPIVALSFATREHAEQAQPIKPQHCRRVELPIAANAEVDHALRLR
jgi:hypothetical protein